GSTPARRFGSSYPVQFKIQTIYETLARPTASKIKRACGKGELKRMSELIGVHYTNQYGSPHALVVILAQGAGEYYDWNDK
ncbi:hypothetical protein PENTCL1PPCAC_8329, partial [Pristionchus entomophagus]